MVHIFTIPSGFADELDADEISNEAARWRSINSENTVGDKHTQHKQHHTGHRDWVHGVSFSVDGLTYMTVSGGEDRRAFKWDSETHERIGGDIDLGHQEGVMGISHSPLGKQYVTVSCDKRVNVFNTADDSLVRSELTGDAVVYDVAHHPNGSMVSN